MPSSPAHVVIVTGAAGGIGYEIVRSLLVEHKAGVVATDIVRGELDSLKQGYPEHLQLVIGNIVEPKISERCVATAVDTFGRLTGLCLNAGVFGPCFRLVDSSVERWTRALEINVLSHLHTLKYAIPELRKTSGRITAATSGAGQAPLFSGWGFYGMSKASVAYLIKQIALEEAKITALGVSPGLCDTKMVSGLTTGTHEGWAPEDVKKYNEFTRQIELITPARAGYTFAAAVCEAVHGLSGQIVDYDDPQLPIREEFKRKSELAVDYTSYSSDARNSASSLGDSPLATSSSLANH